MVPNSFKISCCFRRRMYSSRAAVTASFLVLWRPMRRASSISLSSIARLVAIGRSLRCVAYHTYSCVEPDPSDTRHRCAVYSYNCCTYSTCPRQTPELCLHYGRNTYASRDQVHHPVAMLTEQTDEQLLALAMSGDEDAFTALYRRRQGPVYRFALHMTGSPQLAEEVTQDVFIFLAQ